MGGTTSLKALATKVLERNTQRNAGGTEPQNSGTRGGTETWNSGTGGDALGVPSEAVKEDFSGKDWDTETLALIKWFYGTHPPTEPFELSRGVTVIRPALWWTAMRRDIAAGPNGPRARYGALQSDLRQLHDQQKITPPTSPGQGETTPLTAG